MERVLHTPGVSSTTTTPRRRSRVRLLWTAYWLSVICGVAKAFVSPSGSSFVAPRFKLHPQRPPKRSSSMRKSQSKWTMFLGSDGGILGIGAPEVAVTLLVGYFVLGPSDLYALVKEIGKFVQNIRTLGVEATKSFETSMESQLQLKELRKAQLELNSAFNFRRSINIDDEEQVFEDRPSSAEAIIANNNNDTTDDDTNNKRKKIKRRRRVKKKVPAEGEDTTESENPDLDMNYAYKNMQDEEPTEEEQERVRRREERLARLSKGDTTTTTTTTDDSSGMPDWYTASESDLASKVLPSQPEEAGRFASQLSETWNDQILAKDPFHAIMDRLAILEEEKNAAVLRLEEEFRQRSDLEAQYYETKRKLLEEAVEEIQNSSSLDESNINAKST